MSAIDDTVVLLLHARDKIEQTGQMIEAFRRELDEAGALLVQAGGEYYGTFAQGLVLALDTAEQAKQSAGIVAKGITDEVARLQMPR
jgi:hypothetical protein